MEPGRKQICKKSLEVSLFMKKIRAFLSSTAFLIIF